MNNDIIQLVKSIRSLELRLKSIIENKDENLTEWEKDRQTYETTQLLLIFRQSLVDMIELEASQKGAA